MSTYIQYPSLGEGIAKYATFASFPASAENGALALALDTDTLYAFDSGTMSWVSIASPGGGGVTTMANLDSEVPNSQGATIDGTSLAMQSATATEPGLVNNTTQSFSGNKTFTGTIAASNLSGTNTGDQTITLTGDVTGSGTSSFAATIANSAVTNAKMANMANNTVKGNKSGGAAAPSDLALSDIAEATSSVLTITNGSKAIIGASNLTIEVAQASGSTSGYLSSTDWTTFNNKGAGSVTSVALSVPGTSIFGVTGSPVTTSGTLGLTTTGTSGGIPYFSSTSALSSSAALTANQLIVGGGAGAAPATLAAGSQYQVLVMGAATPAYGAVNLAQAAAVTGTLPVANGGTGAASQTAYAVLCGGTTSTGAYQSIASVGTAGQVLKSNGAGALPSFQASSGTPVFRHYTSSDTWSKPAGLVGIRVTCVGGGGGSGGANSAVSEGSVSGGGGGGEVTIAYIAAASLASSETVTVGAGGTAGASSGTAGGTGGTSSFGSLITAIGGGGGDVQASGTATARSGTPGSGGSGGTLPSGGISLAGNPGTWGYRAAASVFVPSNGGGSVYGGGAIGRNANSGLTGGTYGGGAGGASSNNNTDQAGAVGGAGLVIVEEFY